MHTVCDAPPQLTYAQFACFTCTKVLILAACFTSATVQILTMERRLEAAFGGAQFACFTRTKVPTLAPQRRLEELDLLVQKHTHTHTHTHTTTTDCLLS
jgi:hypothetical protein